MSRSTVMSSVTVFVILFILLMPNLSEPAEDNLTNVSGSRPLEKSAVCTVTVRLEAASDKWRGISLERADDNRVGVQITADLFCREADHRTSVMVAMHSSKEVIAFDGLRISNPELRKGVAPPLIVKESGHLNPGVLLRLPYANLHIRSVVAQTRTILSSDSNLTAKMDRFALGLVDGETDELMPLPPRLDIELINPRRSK